MLTSLGLILIAVGWAVQVKDTSPTKRGQDIQPAFVLLYIAGVVLLALGGLLSTGVSLSLLLNILTGVLAGVVWFKLSR